MRFEENKKAASFEAAFLLFPLAGAEVLNCQRSLNSVLMQDAQNGIMARLQGDGRLRTPLGVFSASCYVPISQEARYFSCSFVSLSMSTPMPASLSREISLSMTAGTGYTFFSSIL